MAEGFPRRFSLASMGGPSTRAFEKREDAFQQLIGDGLLAMSHKAAMSYPTKGEDGSIDSFLEAGAALIEPFQGVPLPAIIECKDHDDTLPGVGNNILGGWAKVRSKLASQAENGWQGSFKPWRKARSYVYVVSAVIPKQYVRETLEQGIRDFFTNLPTEKRPPLERIIVLDWNNARLWLDQFPNVRDSWIGTGVPTILSLNQYRAGLSGFRRFLSSDALPFSAPLPNSAHDPEVLFQRLSDENTAKGVLLVGAGGVGKTRTSYEVALLAEKDGWRVLYVVPTDSPVTFEQVSAAVLSQRSTRTLLIFEYLDQMPTLLENIGALRRSLIPRAREAGIQVACLANSRPGFVWRPNPERDASFSRVDLTLTNEEARSLSEWAVKRTAPKACDVLSDREVFRVCGHRPIIALLVAQQLEKLANAGTLIAESIQPIREDDLLGPWLRRRLAEDELVTPAPQSIWDTALPHPRVVAAASILACAPDWTNGLVAAGDATFRALGSDFDAQKIVQGLFELGWLEQEGLWLVAVHDVVADEVVEQVIFDHLTIRTREFEALTAVAINRARGFGRMAKALTRVQGATSEGRRLALSNASEDWLRRHAGEIGETIAKEAPTHGSYALGAVFGGSVFEESAVNLWSSVVAPWLENFDTDFEARHLLFRGLRAIRSNAPASLIKASLSWLSRWRLEVSSSFVLAPLLHHDDLLPDESSKLNQWAIEWLDTYGDALEAGFVLSALLKRKSLTEAEAGKAIAHALAWLENESYAKSAEAGFVLGPLLGRKEAEAGKAIAHALAWLENESYAKSAEAGFVLGQLLGRKDVKGTQADKIATLTIGWLEVHGSQPRAEVILVRWLESGRPAAGVREVIARWLDANKSHDDMDYLCKAWIEARGDTGLVWEAMLTWLTNHRGEQRAVYITKYIAKGRDLPISAIRDVLSWCCTFPMHEDILWRFTQLGSNLLNEGIATDFIRAAEIILPNWIRSDRQLNSIECGQLTTLISYLLGISERLPYKNRDSVDTLFLSWLRHPGSFESKTRVNPFSQRPFFLTRLLLLLDAAYIEVTVDREQLKRFAAWVDAWEPQAKTRIASIFAEIVDRHPAPHIWDQVRLVGPAGS